MPYTKIWIHLVFATKNRFPYLNKSLREKLFEHVLENAHEKGILIDQLNGYTDHIHLLIRILPTQTIAKIVQLIKGESSFWINKNKLTKDIFEWQDEYFAASIGPTEYSRVFKYIQNQENHHNSKSYEKEYSDIIKKYESTKAIQ